MVPSHVDPKRGNQMSETAGHWHPSAVTRADRRGQESRSLLASCQTRANTGPKERCLGSGRTSAVILRHQREEARRIAD